MSRVVQPLPSRWAAMPSTEAVVTMHLVAVAPGGLALHPLFPPGLDLPATSSFVPVMKAGGFVFVAGLLAAHGAGDLGGIAPEAKVPEGHLWKGQRIQLELEYLLRQKLEPALAAAGSSLACGQGRGRHHRPARGAGLQPGVGPGL